MHAATSRSALAIAALLATSAAACTPMQPPKSQFPSADDASVRVTVDF